MSALWFELDEQVNVVERASDMVRIFSAFAYEASQGGCYECTKLRLGAASYEYIGGQEFLGNPNAVVAIARDRKQNRCAGCVEQDNKKKAGK